MAKPSLMDGLKDASSADPEDGSDESGLDSGAAWEELHNRFLNGDPVEQQDALRGMMSICEEQGEGESPIPPKPSLVEK